MNETAFIAFCIGNPGDGDRENAFIANHFRARPKGYLESGVNLRRDAVAVLHLPGKKGVRAAGVHALPAEDALGVFFGNGLGKTDRIAAYIPQGSAAHLFLQANVVFIAQREGEFGTDQFDPADQAFGDQRFQVCQLRVHTIHKGFQQRNAIFLRGGSHFVYLGDGHRQRFFA